MKVKVYFGHMNTWDKRTSPWTLDKVCAWVVEVHNNGMMSCYTTDCKPTARQLRALVKEWKNGLKCYNKRT